MPFALTVLKFSIGPLKGDFFLFANSTLLPVMSGLSSLPDRFFTPAGNAPAEGVAGRIFRDACGDRPTDLEPGEWIVEASWLSPPLDTDDAFEWVDVYRWGILRTLLIELDVDLRPLSPCDDLLKLVLGVMGEGESDCRCRVRCMSKRDGGKGLPFEVPE